MHFSQVLLENAHRRHVADGVSSVVTACDVGYEVSVGADVDGALQGPLVAGHVQRLEVR